MTATAFVPSTEQAEVIAHQGGHLQVIACAVAGMTEAISRRVALLVSNAAYLLRGTAKVFVEGDWPEAT